MSLRTAPESSAEKPPGILFRPASITDQLNLKEIFRAEQEVQVELGSGDGSFLINYAKAHPEINFLGVERLLGRLRKIEKKANRNGLQNVRALRLEASYLVRYLLPTGSIEAVHIYFPDPWPKRRHWKNRLINEEFTKLLERPLKKGGVVYLRTDNADYFEQMQEVFGGNEQFKPVATPAEMLEFKTDFEREFNKRGIPTLVAAYRLGE